MIFCAASNFYTLQAFPMALKAIRTMPATVGLEE